MGQKVCGGLGGGVCVCVSVGVVVGWSGNVDNTRCFWHGYDLTIIYVCFNYFIMLFFFVFVLQLYVCSSILFHAPLKFKCDYSPKKCVSILSSNFASQSITINYTSSEVHFCSGIAGCYVYAIIRLCFKGWTPSQLWCVRIPWAWYLLFWVFCKQWILANQCLIFVWISTPSVLHALLIYLILLVLLLVMIQLFVFK